MSQIKIYADSEAKCVFFDGSTVSPKFIGTTTASAHPTLSDRIIIKRTDRFEDDGTTFRTLFKKLLYTRVCTRQGAAAGASRDETVTYLNQQFNSLGAQFDNPATLDFRLDDTGTNVITSTGSTFFINQLRAVADSTEITIQARNGSSLYYYGVPVANITIDGVAVSSVQATAVNSLNGLFTKTQAFITSDLSIQSGSVSGSTLTLTMSDSSTIDVDVTSLSVDSDDYTASGAISGTDLVLTMQSGSTVTIDVTNLLNGASSGFSPSISDQAFTLTESDSVNFTPALDSNSNLTTMYAFNNLPSWLTGNQSSGQVLGTAPAHTGGTGDDVYTFTVTSANPFGSDSATITLNVQENTFTNSKSVEITGPDFLGANAALMDSVLGRSSNGAGSGDAFTISFWIKPTSSSSGRVMVYFGSNDTANGGHFEARLTSTNKVRFKYGTNNNYIQLTSSTVLSASTWHHVMIAYTGGSTENGSGGLSTSYGQFSIFIDGSQETTSNSHSNYGYSGSVSGQNFRVGKLVSGNSMNGERIDELAIWGSDQSSNVSSIYNSGATQDLSALSTSPNHWWRMGDGDSHPNIQDNVGSVTFVMYNMTASNFVNDTP